MKIYYQFKEDNSQAFTGTTDSQFREENTNTFIGMSDSTPISGGTSDYEKLRNKPRINSIELIGSISLPELGLRAIYYDTTANWNMQHSLITEEGAVYIYSDYTTYTDGAGNVTPLAGIKIGDGNAYLIDVPFVTDAITAALLNHINNHEVHITAQEREFWNNKVSAYIDPGSSEILVLSKTFYELGGELRHA